MQRLWWEIWPDRLEMELAALADSGIPYERDDEAFREGIMRLRLWPTVKGETLELTAVYPELFPYFRFEIFAGDIGLIRHQNPFEGHVCLIGRSTSNWHTTDTVARYVTDPKRLPALLTSGRSTDRAAVSDLEESQAEPFSDYYHYAAESIILVDSAWAMPETILEGVFDVAVQSVGHSHLRGAIMEIRGSDNKTVLARADNAVRARTERIIRGRWLRVSEALKGRNGEELLHLVKRENPAMARAHSRSVNGWQTDVVGIVFPEELRERVTGDGWVFIVRTGQGKRKRRKERIFAVRAGRAGPGDLRARIPDLGAFGNKRVALFGLGGIGAPAAIEFAQAGLGELRVLDYDFVDPGTAVRWPLGLSAAGQNKTTALLEFLQREYPYTSVRTWNRRIGSVLLSKQPGMQSERDVLEGMLDGVDLVFDATAELGMHHVLSDLAWERGIPYLTAHSTLGAAGGLVAVIDPQKPTGCWLCLQKALYEDKTIKEPPFDEAANVQPLGCADPTFTGAGFDVKEVTLEALRAAAGMLVSAKGDGYPAISWDVAVLSLRDTNGNRVSPRWETYELPSSPECECVQKQGASGYSKAS